jgi:hypothetical protein
MLLQAMTLLFSVKSAHAPPSNEIVIKCTCTILSAPVLTLAQATPHSVIMHIYCIKAKQPTGNTHSLGLRSITNRTNASLHGHVSLPPMVEEVIDGMGWGLAEWLERCASIPKITGSNPSGGSELTFRSDVLLTVRGGSM